MDENKNFTLLIQLKIGFKNGTDTGVFYMRKESFSSFSDAKEYAKFIQNKIDDVMFGKAPVFYIGTSENETKLYKTESIDYIYYDYDIKEC